MIIHEAIGEAETANIASQLAASAKTGHIFTLSGPLGAGKSVFARAFIRHLCGPDTDVPSPTYTLVQTYESDKAPIWHFDLYRLSDPDEIYETGWEEAITQGILLVEWPERLDYLKPAKTIDIFIEPLGEQTRRIEIHGL